MAQKVQAMNYITHVRYNAARTHIDRVQGYGVRSGPFGPNGLSRQDVVTNILAGGTWATDNPISGDQARVQIFQVNAQQFIKTAPDSTPRDNLGNLPEF